MAEARQFSRVWSSRHMRLIGVRLISVRQKTVRKSPITMALSRACVRLLGSLGDFTSP